MQSAPFPTIAAAELERLGVGTLIDVLVWLYDAGWMAGSGQPVPRPTNAALAAILEDVRERHQITCERLMDFIEPGTLPDWLARLPFDDTPPVPRTDQPWLTAHGITPLPPLGRTDG